MTRKPSVLFLCPHNSDRSQLAEALLREEAGHRFEVMSAGLFPRPIHPLTRRVLEEIGVDGAALASKSVRRFLARSAVNYAVIVCEEGPGNPRLYPFASRTIRWPVEDPDREGDTEVEALTSFRRVRDAIRAKLRAWLVEVDVADAVETVPASDSAVF